MLNKLMFNNLVISNKKGIQQSRVQTINKLVHKIRKLKTMLEKHPDNTKCKERIRKSTETMELLKKLKRVDIIKKVLLVDKPAPSVITNGLATPEEVGVALLCMNKVMQGLIKRFKTDLQLNEAKNDEWKEALLESSKRRQKIERTEEKRRKRLEIKQQKAMGRKRQEWLVENKLINEEKEDSVDKDLNVSTTSGWQIEELTNENDITEADEKNENKSNKPLLKKPIKEKYITKKTLKPNKKTKVFVIKREETASSTEEVDSEKSSIEIKPVMEDIHKIVNMNKKQLKTIAMHQNESPQDTEEEPEEEMVVDPFFITDTGENYMSTAVIKRDQNAHNENNEKRDLHMIKLNNYDKTPTELKDRRQQSRDKNPRDSAQNRQQNNNRWNIGDGRGQKNKWNNKQSNERSKFSQNNKWNDRNNHKIRDQDFKHKKYANTSNEQNLHPSWAAKQKLKPVIAGFQGKKKIFGDDDNSNKTQPQSQTKTNKPAASKPTKSEQDSLHPSWAAKQKLKPTITAFQGKKITFGDDE